MMKVLSIMMMRKNEEKDEEAAEEREGWMRNIQDRRM